MRLLISGTRRNSNTIGAFIVENFDGSFAWEFLTYPDAHAKLLTSPIYKIINRFFPSVLVRKMDKLFLQQVEEFKPTVIMVFKGMEISQWSLKKIRAKKIRLANYNFDHPFEFFSKGTGNRFVKEAIPYYDLHISYSSVIAAALHKKYNVKTAWIPFGFHLTNEEYNDVLKDNRQEINRVCFVGNPDDHRVEVLTKLMKRGLPVDVYGFGWEKYFKSTENFYIHAPRKAYSFWQDPLEFWKVIRQYRVQLNFFRPHNEGSHNLRTFEVPAAGGILLTPASEEQAGFFTENEEIFFYTDFESLFRQCNYLLEKDSEWVSEVRKKARNKSVVMDYSYQRRTKDLLAVLNEI